MLIDTTKPKKDPGYIYGTCDFYDDTGRRVSRRIGSFGKLPPGFSEFQGHCRFEGVIDGKRYSGQVSFDIPAKTVRGAFMGFDERGQVAADRAMEKIARQQTKIVTANTVPPVALGHIR